MRILYVVHQFYPEFSGGTERVTLGLAKMAQRAGHFVRILTCVADNPSAPRWRQGVTDEIFDTSYQGIPVSAIRLSSQDTASAGYTLDFDEPLVVAICELLGEERFDVCHVMHTMRMMSAVQAIQNYKLPYVVTLTDFFLPCYRVNLIDTSGAFCSGPERGAECVRKCLVPAIRPDFLMRRAQIADNVLRLASRVVCPSRFVAGQIQQEYEDLPVRVLPHGIDFSGCKVSLEPPETDNIIFGFLGSIGPVKGVDLLIRAFKEVDSDGARLHIYGGFFDNVVFEQEIRSLAEHDSRVELFPEVPRQEVFEVLQSFSLLCVPSVVPETYSLVLHEAAAANVPAMVTSIGAPSDFVSEHGCGAVVTVGSISAWTERMRSVLAAPEVIEDWKKKLPLPFRVEEEAFFYQSLYQECIAGGVR